MKTYICTKCESTDLSMNVWAKQKIGNFDIAQFTCYAVIEDEGDCYCHHCDSEGSYTCISRWHSQNRRKL